MKNLYNNISDLTMFIGGFCAFDAAIEHIKPTIKRRFVFGMFLMSSSLIYKLNF
tara:strand:+ start:228 stop:389 length:162 start_codon:yes stop_codon:yes gene_type:complete